MKRSSSTGPTKRAQKNSGATLALINNKHPLVPMSTLRAGYRLVLHGLATETQHAILVQCKRAQAQARSSRPT